MRILQYLPVRSLCSHDLASVFFFLPSRDVVWPRTGRLDQLEERAGSRESEMTRGWRAQGSSFCVDCELVSERVVGKRSNGVNRARLYLIEDLLIVK